MKVSMIRMIGLFILLFIIAAYPFAISEGASKGESEKVTVLNQKRRELYSKGKFDEAIPYAEKVLEIRERISGKEHPDVADSLDNLALLYRVTGQYEKAEPLYKRALKIREKTVEEDHPSIALSYFNLASLYRLMGKYAEAEKLHKRALKMREKVLEKDHPDIAQSLNGMAMLYVSLGRYSEAESLFKRALEIREKVLKSDHLDIAWSLDNLGDLCFRTGRYAEAEPLYRRALEIQEKVLGKDHPDIASTLNNLGNLYLNAGRYAEAESLYRRGLEIREKALRSDHPSIATNLNSLAWLYFTTGRYAEAEPLYEKAIEIQKRVLGDQHPSLAQTYNNLAELYRKTGRLNEALALHNKALEMREKRLGRNHPAVAQSLNNLALATKGYKDKEALYKRGLEIRERALGKDHPDVAKHVNGLAFLYAAMENHSESHQYFKRGTSILDKKRENVFLILSEKQKLNYMQEMKGIINAFLTHSALYMQSSTSAIVDTFNMWIRWKGAVLEAQGRYMDAVMHADDPQITKKFDDLTNVRRDIVRLQLSKPEGVTVEDYIKNLQELEKRKESLETELSRLSKNFALEKIVGQADIKRITEILPQDSAYLDFAMVREYDFKSRRGGVARYFMFLLVPGRKAIVKLMDIEKADEVDRHIHAYLDEMHKVKLFQEPPNVNVLKKEARLLYELVIKPIEPYLKERKQLFISPDGMLNLIPFEIFITGEGKYLMEDYIINYIAAGRDIVRFTDTTVAKGDVIIMADPDYDMGAKMKDQVVRELRVAKTTQGDVSRGVSEMNFIRLPDTKEEADNIEKILREGSSQKVRNYQDKKALEEILFSVESPKVLHLATHGYFLEDEEAKEVLGEGLDTEEVENIPTVGIENPMLRSGIVLAGVNTSLKEGRDDGLVSAEKILGLRLKGTDMVVLSACETGVGDVKNGEGVFGLKRAFILSGSKTVVMSLWSVPSKETTELMTHFYKIWSDGKKKAEALRQAKMEMMRKKQSPFYWGAFVMVGKPE